MPKLIVLYPPPTDVEAFERAYFADHAPMVARLRGLQKFVSAQVLGSPAGMPPFQRVAELYFDSMDALHVATRSSFGRSVAAHAAAISTGGPPVVLIAEDDTSA
jgi:uncharacterized protein (TIGR02118 family)